MDHFTYKNGELFAEDVAIAEIAKQVGTPFYVYSTATLTRHFTVFRDSFAPLTPKICYAVKANPNLAVLKTLAKLGSGADVVSEGEIRQALAAGIKASDIVFSGVGKTRAEMAYALEQNIFEFNIESEPELLALSEVAVSKNKIAHVAFRVNPDVIPHTHAKISTGQKESKFGVPISRAEAIYKQAAGLPGIQVQGVSVHIGSQLTQLAPFLEAFKRVRQLVETLRSQGHNITTLDLGGGLGIPYGKSDEPPLPAAYAQNVKEIVSGMDCQLVFEPGRVLVGNAGILVSQVIYIKQGETRKYVIIDAGMNDLIRPAMYDAYHELVPVKENKASQELFDIVGPVCETGDIFAAQRSLPKPKPGDLMAFRTAGAYGAAMSGTYNSRLLVPEVMVNGKNFAIVRPRQTYEQLLAQDSIPDWLK